MNMKRGLITLLAALLCIAAAAQERQPQPGHAETTQETGTERPAADDVRPEAASAPLRSGKPGSGAKGGPTDGRIAPVPAAAPAAGEVLSLRECLEKGLERNYDIRIVRNEERITDNDATAANAGMLPTIDLSAGYGSNVNRIRTTPREGDVTTAKGVYDGTFDAGVALNWTLFDGFRIRADYRKLQELKEKGALQTRLTIEDFIASFTAEYYNFVQQTLRLENFRYAMALSRERLRIAEAWYHVGSSAQLDVLQARVDFNADSSQYMSQQEAVVASRIRINELLANEELDRRFLVRDTVIAIDDALQWDVLVAETRTANAELLMADRDNAISELELQSIRSRN